MDFYYPDREEKDIFRLRMRQQAAVLLKRERREGGKLGASLIRPERLSGSTAQSASYKTPPVKAWPHFISTEKSKLRCLWKRAKKILFTGENTLISRTDGVKMNSHLKANGIWISNWRNVWFSLVVPSVEGGQGGLRLWKWRKCVYRHRLRHQKDCVAPAPDKGNRPERRQVRDKDPEHVQKLRGRLHSWGGIWGAHKGPGQSKGHGMWNRNLLGPSGQKALVKHCVCRCQTLVTWDGDKLVCIQKGEKANRGWKQWIEGDLLHLVSTSKSRGHDKLRPLRLSSSQRCWDR